jgi:hypothetical protein
MAGTIQHQLNGKPFLFIYDLKLSLCFLAHSSKDCAAFSHLFLLSSGDLLSFYCLHSGTWERMQMREWYPQDPAKSN